MVCGPYTPNATVGALREAPVSSPGRAVRERPPRVRRWFCGPDIYVRPAGRTWLTREERVFQQPPTGKTRLIREGQVFQRPRGGRVRRGVRRSTFPALRQARDRPLRYAGYGRRFVVSVVGVAYHATRIVRERPGRMVCGPYDPCKEAPVFPPGRAVRERPLTGEAMVLRAGHIRPACGQNVVDARGTGFSTAPYG